MELLREDLERSTSRNHGLSPTAQVLVALRFFASGSFLQVISDTVGLPQSTVSRTIRDVSAALIQKRIEFIHWPTNNDEIQRVKEGFFRKGGFPGVIGCVHGTHVRLQRPSQNEADYVNRKGYHSINVQAICDHRGEKLEIFFYYFLGKNIHLIPKWRPRNYSFVCMLISPLRLIFTSKFFCFLYMLTRRRGLINMQTKE